MSWGLWDGLCSFRHLRLLSALSAALAPAFSRLPCLPCPSYIPVSVTNVSASRPLICCANDDLWGPYPLMRVSPVPEGSQGTALSSVML